MADGNENPNAGSSGSTGSDLPPVTGASHVTINALTSRAKGSLNASGVPGPQAATGLGGSAASTTSTGADLSVTYKIGEVEDARTSDDRSVQGSPAAPVSGELTATESPDEVTARGAMNGPGTPSYRPGLGEAAERAVADIIDRSQLPSRALGNDAGADFEVDGTRVEVKAFAQDSATATLHRIVPAFSNDQASSKDRVDGLDMTADATAFAQIATSRSTPPPLAVGVFGPWGAGKSFFMDLVHNSVNSIAEQSRNQGPDSPFHKEFHDKVVQIRFNAWHYAETNLWASLVGHIFQELSSAVTPKVRDDIFGRLSTARTLTLDTAASLVKARQEQAHAKAELASAQADLTAAKARPQRTANLFADLAVSSFQDKDDENIVAARRDLADAAKELGIGQVISSARELTSEGQSLLRNGVQAKDMLASIAQNLGSPWIAAFWVFAIVAVPSAALAALHLCTEYFQAAKSPIAETVASALAIASVLTAWFKNASGPVLRAISLIKAAKKRVDEHVSKHLEKYEKIVADNEDKLNRAKANVGTAEDVLRASTARLAEVSDELRGRSPANRLIQFVRARASDGEYAKHLGLVSTIRKDFEELSNLVSGVDEPSLIEENLELATMRRRVREIVDSARQNKYLTDEEIQGLNSLVEPQDSLNAPFRRIVLFIDDVDRCPPNKVVEVLQAVHMLLAFRLFVVFVAVDVRWVAGSLSQQYQGMLKGPGSGDDPLTSASDYLEKIFQIPYWVPSVSPDAGKKLLTNILARQRIQTNPEASSDITEVLRSKAAQGSSEVQFVDSFIPVSLDKSEGLILEHFAGLLDSPRKIIRLANISRFLKVRRQLGEGSDALEHTTLLFAQLAIATATPDRFNEWRRLLEEMSTTLIQELATDSDNPILLASPSIDRVLQVLLQRGQGHLELQRLRATSAWAGRLSFATSSN